MEQTLATKEESCIYFKGENTGRIYKRLQSEDQFMTLLNKDFHKSKNVKFYPVISETGVLGVFNIDSYAFEIVEVPQTDPAALKNYHYFKNIYVPVRDIKRMKVDEEDVSYYSNIFDVKPMRFNLDEEFKCIVKDILEMKPKLHNMTCMASSKPNYDPNMYSGTFVFPDGNIYTIVRQMYNAQVYPGIGDHCLLMNSSKLPLIKFELKETDCNIFKESSANWENYKLYTEEVAKFEALSKEDRMKIYPERNSKYMPYFSNWFSEYKHIKI